MTNFLDEVCRRLPGLLHVVMTLMAIPYVLLATFFVMVGHVAAQRGLWAILDAVLQSFNWFVTWGAIAIGVTLFTVCGLGLIESVRWWASLALALLMALSLSILLFYRPSFPDFGEFVFLAPGFLILAICCWRLIYYK